jgi:hypothetical protein
MTPRCPKRLPGDKYTGESQLPGGEYTGESRLPSSKYTRESITNSNNSLNIQKNLKSFLGWSNGTRRKCLMKKTRVKKSRDTVPLSFFLVPLLQLRIVNKINQKYYKNCLVIIKLKISSKILSVPKTSANEKKPHLNLLHTF